MKKALKYFCEDIFGAKKSSTVNLCACDWKGVACGLVACGLVACGLEGGGKQRQHCRRDGEICVNLSVGLQSIFKTEHHPSSLSASNRPRLQMGKPKRTKGTTAAAARAG